MKPKTAQKKSLVEMEGWMKIFILNEIIDTLRNSMFTVKPFNSNNKYSKKVHITIEKVN